MRFGGWFACAALLLAHGGAAAQAAQAVIPCPPELTSDRGAVAADERNRGLLWRVTRDGRSSFLYATLHLGRPHWRVPGLVVQAALRDSDLVAVELDTTDPDIARQLVVAMQEMSHAVVNLPEAMRERIAALVRRACLPEGALWTMHPVMQAMTLSMLESRWEDLHPQFGQEVSLKRYALEHHKPVLSLETPAQQFAALVPEAGDDLTAALARALQQLEFGGLRVMVRRLADAWERGDLPELAAYASWCECVQDAQDRRALKRLIDDRNVVLAARIAELHQRDLKVFAAVGALHMTGAQALPTLMQQRGFTVERVTMPR